MGYALNAGIAAILARPAPAGAVVLAGDGGFQMTLQVSRSLLVFYTCY
jgi:thiamine pyrophosphate-dependent acetolactate synthase large subunit-like protein